VSRLRGQARKGRGGGSVLAGVPTPGEVAVDALPQRAGAELLADENRARGEVRCDRTLSGRGPKAGLTWVVPRADVVQPSYDPVHSNSFQNESDCWVDNTRGSVTVDFAMDNSRLKAR
jgi:hypothetical protein